MANDQEMAFEDHCYFKTFLWKVREPPKLRIFSWLKWRYQKPPEAKALDRWEVRTMK